MTHDVSSGSTGSTGENPDSTVGTPDSTVRGPDSTAGIPRTLCAELAGVRDGERVRVEGWVHRRRELAALTFLVVRDRTGLAQVVVRGDRDGRPAVPPEETTVSVVGTATANPQAPGGIEVTEPVITPLTEPAATPPVELWRPALTAALPTLLDHAPVTWRHPAQ